MNSCYAVPIKYILKLVIAMLLRRVFGRNVKYYRFQKNMTQEQLAELTDLSPRYISNIENGGGNVSLDTIEMLVDALGIEFQDLFTTRNEEITIKKVNMRRKVGQ